MQLKGYRCIDPIDRMHRFTIMRNSFRVVCYKTTTAYKSILPRLILSKTETFKIAIIRNELSRL